LPPLTFDILAESRATGARAGRITTPHGFFDTPAFMPVGTKASVKGLLPELVRRTGSQIILNNTYHLLLRPGAELIREMGGAHRFMNWPGPILTDSGGFQAYSMADTNAIDDDGVTFKSIVDGSDIRLTPERAMEVQAGIGADIIMALDDCPPAHDPATGPSTPTRRKLAQTHARRGMSYEDRLAVANERTVRWLERCKRAQLHPDEQALFGIVQGGTSPELRQRSASEVCAIDLPGYAIGGVAVGESQEEIAQIVRQTAPLLPKEKPRYLMGVGYERDIVAAVLAGVDMFDCVLPTRNGRNANAFTRQGQVRLKNARFRADLSPIEPDCDCPACDPEATGGDPARPVFSRAYIRHLFLADEMLGPILVSLHNVRHFQRLMLDIRRAIAQDDWRSLALKWPVAVPGFPAGLLD